MKRCRSMLFMPGNNPGMLTSAGCLGADAVIFDLEDAVAQMEKDAARALVQHALGAQARFALTSARSSGPAIPVVVRINGLDTPWWQADIAAVVRGGADGVLLPKCSSPDDVLKAVACLEEEEQKRAASSRSRPPVWLMAIVEGALGLENAFASATAHPRLIGMLLGGEDLTAELGATRSPEGDEIAYARSRLLVACRAAGIKAVDSPYPFVTDMQGLERDAAFAARLGFDGKAVISPHHVRTVNQAFTPTEERIRWASRVMAAARRAQEQGKGAVSLDGMMIDVPVIKRAERILLLADGAAGPIFGPDIEPDIELDAGQDSAARPDHAGGAGHA